MDARGSLTKLLPVGAITARTSSDLSLLSLLSAHIVSIQSAAITGARYGR
jgi:hypothetical protein